MADPNIPIGDDDIRYEDRSGCFVLVDPTRDRGRRDVAMMWREGASRWRWRLDSDRDGTPYGSAEGRDAALEGMLAAYAREHGVAERLAAQRPRFSFGAPQIVKA